MSDICWSYQISVNKLWIQTKTTSKFPLALPAFWFTVAVNQKTLLNIAIIHHTHYKNEVAIFTVHARRERKGSYPGIAKNKLKSWLRCLQQLHSFMPS
jgi:hypothetical protein